MSVAALEPLVMRIGQRLGVGPPCLWMAWPLVGLRSHGERRRLAGVDVRGALRREGVEDRAGNIQFYEIDAVKEVLDRASEWAGLEFDRVLIAFVPIDQTETLEVP